MIHVHVTDPDGTTDNSMSFVNRSDAVDYIGRLIETYGPGDVLPTVRLGSETIPADDLWAMGNEVNAVAIRAELDAELDAIRADEAERDMSHGARDMSPQSPDEPPY